MPTHEVTGESGDQITHLDQLTPDKIKKIGQNLIMYGGEEPREDVAEYLRRHAEMTEAKRRDLSDLGITSEQV